MHFIKADSREVKQQWDELISAHGASVFSESTYLDATSEHWCLLISDDFKSGMACPYVVKAGVKVLVTPFFNRFMEWVGELVPEAEIISMLKSEFPVANLQLGRGFLPNGKIYQRLVPGNLKLNQQAKRTLNKSTGYIVENKLDTALIMELLTVELVHKIPGIDHTTLPVLERLVNAYTDSRLRQFNLLEAEKWLGGIWILENEHTVLYLKGTTGEEAKKSGGMYRLMLTAIEYAASREKVFDFGGSNVESVRRFNLNFGAEDVVYSQLRWNEAPFWWKILKKIRDKWTRR